MGDAADDMIGDGTMHDDPGDDILDFEQKHLDDDYVKCNPKWMPDINKNFAQYGLDQAEANKKRREEEHEAAKKTEKAERLLVRELWRYLDMMVDKGLGDYEIIINYDYIKGVTIDKEAKTLDLHFEPVVVEKGKFGKV